jgi:hypothetical protein
MRKLSLPVLLAAMAAGPPALADWVEFGDAGSTLGTAQVVNAGGALNSIFGSIAVNGDVDLYRFIVTDFTIFSATNNSISGPTDMQVFLFSSTGMGIASNDDVVFFETPGALPVGDTLYVGLPAGEYLVGISRYDVEPESIGGQIFSNDVPFNFDIVGPNGPGGLSPLTGFAGVDNSGSDPSEYRLDLTGVVIIPLPTAVAMASPGLLMIWSPRRRRR